MGGPQTPQQQQQFNDQNFIMDDLMEVMSPQGGFPPQGGAPGGQMPNQGGDMNFYDMS